MLLDLGQLVRKHRMEVTGVIHGGAHLAEEANQYDRLFKDAPVTWIEANPAVHDQIIDMIEHFPNQRLIEACLWSTDGETKTFHVTNYDGMSSSLLAFGTHPTFSPDTMFTHTIEVSTRTLDSLDAQHHLVGNLLNLDLQGVEGPVLQGARHMLGRIDYVYCEANIEEVYVGCTRLHELDTYLGSFGFRRADTSLVPGQGWGDALFIKKARRP